MKPPLSHSRGIALLEALVAMLIMGVGVMALLHLQTQQRIQWTLAQDHEEASRLAEQRLEALRHPAPGALDTPPPGESIQVQVGARVFRLWHTVQAPGSPSWTHTRRVDIHLAWVDREGHEQTHTLSGLLNAQDAALAVTRMTPRGSDSLRAPQGRHRSIPRDAMDLSSEHAAFQPDPGGPYALVLARATGEVLAVCPLAAGSALDKLQTLACLKQAPSVSGWLLSGDIQFHLGENPSTTGRPGDLADAAVLIHLDRGLPAPAPQCFDDATDALRHRRRHIRYHCVVYPNQPLPTRWSGRSELVGLDIGSRGGQLKVCRFSADHNGNGHIDNIEHPSRYIDVTGALPHQNFLVIHAQHACPADHPPSQTPGRPDASTLQHQP